MTRRYVPDVGDLVWLTFDPQAGREQAGRRPALVLSPAAYNKKSSLALVCPITSQAKGYPFEVPMPSGLSITGVILADHIKSLDWNERRVRPAGKLPSDAIAEVRDRIALLLGF